MKKFATKRLCPREKLRPCSIMFKILLLSLFFNGHALDSVAVQNQKITLELRNASLNQLFLEIEKHSDYSFVYNTREIQKLGTRDFNFTGQALDQVLEECLQGSGFSYQM